MTFRAIGAAALAAFAFSSPVDAAITVLGGGFAHACYQAAEFKRPVKTGLMDCDTALKEETLSPKDRAATHVNRGILHMFERDFDGAIADYDIAIRISPKLAEAYVNKGIAVLHRGSNHGYAVELLSKGLSLDPVRPEVAFYSRGVANEMAGNTREAYYDYNQAAALKPEWEDPQKELKRFKVVDQ
jgi:tetratricopeptide (TPR) repeat protein